MKTYSQLRRDLNEFKGINKFMQKYQPLKGVTRVLNVKDMVSKDKSIGDRISSGIGVVKPYDIGGMLMKPIFDQGKSGSLVNRGIDKLSKVKGFEGLKPDPKTDLGKNLGDKIGKKIDQILNRRKQNMGASDLKGSSSGMS